MFTGYEKCVILVEFLSSLGRPGKAMGRMRQVLSCIRAQLPIPQWLVPLELVKRFLARGPNKNHDFQGGFIGKNDGFNGKNE